MIIQPPYPETMLIYGEHACGKTHAWLSIADLLRNFDSDAKFHVLDSDRAVELNIQHYPDLQESGMVKIHQIQGFEDAVEETNKILKLKIRRQDWIVVDKACDIWEDAAPHWVESRLGTDISTLEKEYRTQSDGKAKGGSAVFNYYGGGINPMWKQWLKSIMKPGCNVIFVSSESELVSKDSGAHKVQNDVSKQFETIKKKPALQKGTPFKFSTILHFSQPYFKQFRVTTIRERGVREWTKSEPIGDFGTEYILGRAMWEVS